MSDRKSLIRLASAMPKGSKERRSILAGLSAQPKQAGTRFISREAKRLLMEGLDKAKHYVYLQASEASTGDDRERFDEIMALYRHYSNFEKVIDRTFSS